MTTTYQKAVNREYVGGYHPTAPTKPTLPKDPTPFDYRIHADRMEVHAENMEKYRLAKAEYDRREQELLAQFRRDLEEEFEVVGHPKADKLYRMAWEEGHSSGLPEVASRYEDLVELIK